MLITRAIETAEAGTVTVRELFVKEARAFFIDGAIKNADRDFIDSELVGETLSLSMLAFMSDVTPETFDKLTLSEVADISKVARELNASFFRLTSRLFDLAKLGDGPSQASSSINSSEPLAALSA